MCVTQLNRQKVFKLLGNQFSSRLNYKKMSGDWNGGGVLKMASMDYPAYLQTFDLLNFIIVMLAYDRCKVYKYGYFFPKKLMWPFAIIWHPSYTRIVIIIKFKRSQTFPTTTYKAYLYAPIYFM